MEKTRRQVLATTATVSAVGLAGCSSGGSTGPQYETNMKDQMLLSTNAFPDGWERDEDFNENFDVSFFSEDESIIVLISVEIFEDITSAEDRMETSRAGVSEANDYPIADEAFWATRNEELACTLFRHSNAVGQSCATRQSGMDVNPDQARSQDYATEMYEQWGEL